MQWLTSISVRRPVFATVMILAIVVVGVVGYLSLGVDKYPKVDFPVITIVTPYPGASPKAVESDVTLKIEEAVNTVSGLESLTSSSTEGVSFVVAQFELEVQPNQAVQDINERIGGVLRDLPPGTRPEVRRVDPDAAPILVVAVSGPPEAPIRDLTRFADKQVKQRLERVPGVGQVAILGGQDRQIDVVLDPMRLAAAGVSAIEVEQAIATSNVNEPAGRIESGPINVTTRVDARARQPEQIGALVVRQQGDHPVRVRDVAEIVDAEEDPETAAVRDGASSVVLTVRKQTGTNTVAIVDRVLEELATLRGSLPPGYAVDVVRDNSVQIRVSTAQVLEHLVIGSALAALVVLLFLGSLRSTLIAAVSMPVSIIATFGLMMAAGFTLNLMTLLALALAVGIVIDDAIVVLENIHRYIHEKRMTPMQAAIHATREIGLAVLATTFSLMAVFLPVAFMSGIVGRFLKSFGLTMAFAIAVSMFVAFTLTPMMAARMLPPPPTEGAARRSWLERGSDLVYRPLLRAFSAILAFGLRRRWVVALLIVGSCATTVPLAQRVGGDFLPASDDAQFEIYVQTPEGTSLAATTLFAERLARRTRAVPGVEATLVTVADTDLRQPNVGRVFVQLVDPSRRALSQAELMARVRDEVLRDVPAGTRVAVQTVEDFSAGGQNAAVSYVITGPDLDRLEQYGRDVMAAMRKVPGVVDLDSSTVEPTTEATVRPDFARAASLGVEPAAITRTLAVLVGGVEASTYEYLGDQYPVFLRAAVRFRDDPAALSLVMLPSRTVGQVPLADVVEVETVQATSKITRNSRERAVTLTMNVAPGHSESTIVASLEAALDGLGMPPGYTAAPFGRSKEMAKLQRAFAFAIVLAIVFMYLVLAAQFESWLYPLVIMLSLPLTVPYALLSLVLTAGSLNIFSMLGIIVLFAMVKKNAILQVDRTNELRRQGMPRDEAVLAASRDRLRPILMTTFAFVAGMVPLVTSTGVGAGFSRAMASVVVGGQTLSLFLTLIAIPVIYTWFDDLSRGIRRVWDRLRGRRESIGRAPELAA